MIRRVLVTAAIATLLVTTFATKADEDHVRWSSNGAPAETYITGGGWTLEQSGAANGLKSSGYCNASLNPIGDPGTERMEPYYFPFIVGQGSNLQGYFDYRPKDTNEAVVAASSNGPHMTRENLAHAF